MATQLFEDEHDRRAKIEKFALQLLTEAGLPDYEIEAFLQEFFPPPSGD